MHKFKVLLKKDLTSIIRTKKFLIILLVLISFAILSPISAKLVGVLLKLLGDNLGNDFQGMNEIAKLLGGASYSDSYVQLAGNVAELFIFILVIIFGTSIVKEKTVGTYHILKMNGVSDRLFILSHVLSQIIMTTVAYIASCLVFFLTTLIIFGEAFPIHFVYSLFSLYMLVIFFIVYMNFVSCYSKSPTMSMVINFSSYFGFVLFNMFGKIKWFFPISLNDNCISVLNNVITKENNIALISAFVWCIAMIAIMMLFKNNKIKSE